MKRFIVVLFSICLSWVVYGQKIIFTPQWTPQAQFAGYYVAYEKGFYKEAGVEVDFQHPSASYSAFNRLLEGSSDIITQQLVQAVIGIDGGLPLVNILQTAQQTALVIASRTKDIKTLEDLKGKKVGVWKSGFADVARIMDVEKDLNIKWIPSLLHNASLFVSGAIDASMCMSYNEYLQIKAAGHDDKPAIRLADTEYNYPEDGLYTTVDFYRKYPEKVKAFAEASRRGWEWAHEHPEETLDIVMKWVRKEHIPTNRVLQKNMLEEILYLQCMPGEDKPSFQLKPEMLDNLSNLLLKYRRIKEPVTMEMLKGGEL